MKCSCWVAGGLTPEQVFKVTDILGMLITDIKYLPSINCVWWTNAAHFLTHREGIKKCLLLFYLLLMPKRQAWLSLIAAHGSIPKRPAVYENIVGQLVRYLQYAHTELQVILTICTERRFWQSRVLKQQLLACVYHCVRTPNKYLYY